MVLVIPVDAAAPKGRLILPQQQVMRELLDIHCSFSACQPEELPALLSSFTEKPSLVITDSQAFKRVAGGHAGGDSPYLLLDSFCEIQRRAGDPQSVAPERWPCPGGR